MGSCGLYRRYPSSLCQFTFCASFSKRVGQWHLTRIPCSELLWITLAQGKGTAIDFTFNSLRQSREMATWMWGSMHRLWPSLFGPKGKRGHESCVNQPGAVSVLINKICMTLTFAFTFILLYRPIETACHLMSNKNLQTDEFSVCLALWGARQPKAAIQDYAGPILSMQVLENAYSQETVVWPFLNWNTLLGISKWIYKAESSEAAI